MAEKSFFVTLLSSKKHHLSEFNNSASKFTNVLDKILYIQNCNVSLYELIVSTQVYNLNFSSNSFYVGYKNVHKNAENKAETLLHVQLKPRQSIGSVVDLKKLVNESFRDVFGKHALNIINSDRKPGFEISSTKTWKLLNETNADYSLAALSIDSTALNTISTFAKADAKNIKNFKAEPIVIFENKLGEHVFL